MPHNRTVCKKASVGEPDACARSRINCLTPLCRINGLFTVSLTAGRPSRCRPGCLPHASPNAAAWPHRACCSRTAHCHRTGPCCSRRMEGERFVVRAAVLRPTAIGSLAPFTPAADGDPMFATGTPPIGKAFWLIHGPVYGAVEVILPPNGPEMPLPQASGSAHRHTPCADLPEVAPVASPVTSSGSKLVALAVPELTPLSDTSRGSSTAPAVRKGQRAAAARVLNHCNRVAGAVGDSVQRHASESRRVGADAAGSDRSNAGRILPCRPTRRPAQCMVGLRPPSVAGQSN